MNVPKVFPREAAAFTATFTGSRYTRPPGLDTLDHRVSIHSTTSGCFAGRF